MSRKSIFHIITYNTKLGTSTTQEMQCPACMDDNPEPGAHHSAMCDYYRSPYIGPDAKMWADRLKRHMKVLYARTEDEKRAERLRRKQLRQLELG